MARKKPGGNYLECAVTYGVWQSFLACHRKRSGGAIEGWQDTLNLLFRDGLRQIQSQKNGGSKLSIYTGIYASGSARKTLRITPSSAETATIDQHVETTGYTSEQLIALLIRIGYESIC